MKYNIRGAQRARIALGLIVATMTGCAPQYLGPYFDWRFETYAGPSKSSQEVAVFHLPRARLKTIDYIEGEGGRIYPALTEKAKNAFMNQLGWYNFELVPGDYTISFSPKLTSPVREHKYNVRTGAIVSTGPPITTWVIPFEAKPGMQYTIETTATPSPALPMNPSSTMFRYDVSVSEVVDSSDDFYDQVRREKLIFEATEKQDN